MGLFAVVKVQLNALTIDEHGINNTESIDHTALAPDNEPLTDGFQCLAVHGNPPTDLDVNGQNTYSAPDEAAVDQIVSYQGSGDDLRYRVC